jgi:hypothetical protein
MAVVGDAYVVVRALTNRVRPQIKSAFTGLEDIGRDAGKNISDALNESMAGGGGGSRGGLLSRALGSGFAKEAEAARVKLRTVTQAGYFAAPAFSALAGVLGAVGAGLVTVGAAAGAAATSGILVLGGAFTALIQSAITLKLALAGVGAALQAGLKLQQGSAAQTKAIEAANKRLEKAQLALFRVEQDRVDQIKDIQRANEDAQRSAVDAIISARRSERSYEAAQRNTKKVIEDVTKAREDAIESLQQLRFETEGGAISEKKARIEFEKARDSLQRVQDLPPNSRARQEAELAFAEADLNLRKAIDRNKDLKEEEKKKTVEVAKLRATDIMNTQEVKDAVQNEADARIDASRAVQDALRAQQEADESAADIKSGKAFREINRTLADANDAVKEAKKDLADAKGGGGAADAFADAMKKLSPEAQKFVQFLISIRGEFDKLKASAGRELFPRLEIAIQNLVDNLFPVLNPLLEGTGKVLGDVAINLSKVITDADNLKSLESVWKTNDKFIGNLGTTVGNLYTGFLNILEAAGPLITRFGEWLAVVSGTWAETQKLNNQNGTLTKRFNRLGDITADIGEYLGIFWDGLKDIFAVITEEGGAVDILNGYFKTAAERFRDFTSAGREDGSLKAFFNGATENFTKILSLIGNIVGELLKLGDNQGVGDFTDSLNVAVDTFGRIADKLTGPEGAASSLGTFIEKFALLTEQLTDSGQIEAFFSVLNGALEIANKIFGNEIVQTVLKVLGPVIGLAKGFGLVFRTVGFLGKAITGVFLNIGGTIKKTLGFIKDPFGKLRSGSALARTELQKQMIVDKQKQAAMKGVQLSADQAARAIGLVAPASTKARTAMVGSTAAANTKSAAMRGLGAAATMAGKGLRIAGKALAFIGGPIGILFLVLPLIIENWDKIVAFFKDLVPKIGKIFGDMWNGLLTFLQDAWKNVSTWFTNSFLPGIGDFFKKALEIIAFILFPLPMLLIKFWPEITGFFTNTVFPWLVALPGKVVELAGKVWNFLKDAAVNAWNLLVTWFTTAWDFYRALPGKVLGFAGKVWDFLKDAAVKAWGLLVSWFTTVWNFYRDLPGKVLGFAGKVWTFLFDAAKTAWTNVTGFFTNTVPNFLKSLPAKFAAGLSGLWNALGSGLQAAWAAAKAWWNNNVASKKLTIGGFNVLGVQIPKIELGFPRLAKGGVVPATNGGMMALIGEAGKAERVEPLDADGLSKRDKAMIDFMSGGSRGGTTINVYPSAGMDERQLAELVSRKLAQTMRKGAA